MNIEQEQVQAGSTPLRAVWSTGAIAAGALTLLIAFTGGAPVLPATDAGAQPPATTPPERLAEACPAGDPYYAVAVQVAADGLGPEPAVIALRDTAGDAFGDATVLATQDQVGTVHGLAFDTERQILYASSYFKRGTTYGPAGPGSIYKIDLGAGGTVAPFATLPGHADLHDFTRNADEPAAPLIGKVGLGDLEIADTDDDGFADMLFVANILRGRIERFELPIGTGLPAFDDGARGESWSRDARLFGLAWHNGYLYHGVMNSGERDPAVPTAHVYRSLADGSGLEAVLDVRLDYARPAQWAQWQNPLAPWSVIPSGRAGPAQPMLTDLEFTQDGDMLLGLRDRWTDMMAAFKGTSSAFGAGDVLYAENLGDAWSIVTSPEQLSDSMLVDEATWGGLARHPGLDIFIASALRTTGLDVGLTWLDIRRGNILRSEPAANLAVDAGDRGGSGAGDVEVLCPAVDEPPPGAVATATALVGATETAAPGATAAAATATAAAAPQPTPIPGVAIPQACISDNPFIATTCYPKWFTFPSQFKWPSVVAFRDTPSGSPFPITLAWDTDIGSVWGLGMDPTRNRVLAAAYHKRLVPFGPGGPGAIYGIDIESGVITEVARVPGAVTDPHDDLRLFGANTDTGARDWIGKVSLGDLEYDLKTDSFFVTNLEDRRIYRFDGDGTLLTSFEHGASSEAWFREARPFGLALRDGKLFHGVVHAAEASRKASDLRAVVYESDFDGTGMRSVVDMPLEGVRGQLTLPATISVGSPTLTFDIEWLPWRSGDNDVADSNARMGFYPQPMLSDIEFDGAGNMVLGFRDRQTDMGIGFQATRSSVGSPSRILKPSLGLGDIVRAEIRSGGGDPIWSAALLPEHFRDGLVDQDESALGGLASLLDLGQIVSGYLSASILLGSASTDGAHWFSEPMGDVRRTELLCGPMPFIIIPPTPGAIATPTTTPTPLGGAPGPLVGTHGLSPSALSLSDSPAPTLNSWTFDSLEERVGNPSTDRLLAPDHSEWLPVGSNGDMELLCGPTPTPTDTPPATPTPTTTKTPLPSPTPTATKLSGPIYLPVALGETCDPSLRKADVTLVIDVSTSMLRPTRTGRAKLSAAQEAAEVFVSGLRLDLGEDGDAIAIVGFNDEAWTQSALGTSQRLALTAIESLATRVASGTRLDLALEEGSLALRNPARADDRIPVLVLLTDGLPNRVPTPVPGGTQEDTVISAAARAKAEGVEIFTIGVGRPDAEDLIDRVNAALLRSVATSPDRAFITPDAEELAAIYARIAVRLPCPPERFWPRGGG